MQQNSIYYVHMNMSMKMSKNVAYETTVIETKSHTYETAVADLEGFHKFPLKPPFDNSSHFTNTRSCLIADIMLDLVGVRRARASVR